MLILFSLLKLNLTLLFVLFVPGLVVLHYFFKKETFGWLEKTVLSLGLSLFVIDFFFIFFDRFGIKFSQSAPALTVLCLFFFFRPFFQKKSSPTKPLQIKKEGSGRGKNLIFWIILVSAVVFRLFYLSDKTVPSSTDLGHHLYWAKSIVTFDRLPNYGMPDFIIGEHVVFAFVNYLSGWDFISAWPMALLFVFNIFSILAFFIFARKAISFWSTKNSNQIALLALLIGGALYAFSSPQTSFISGGVIGNLLGNLFIPSILFLFLSAFEKKNSRLALLTILFSATLIYTHHLSSYILLFVLLFFFGFLWLNDLLRLFSKEKNFLFFSRSFFQTFFSPKVILTLFLFVAFIFLIEPPSYLNKSAVDIAVGAPSKGTRTGYDWLSIEQTLGGWRFFGGLVGFVLFAILVVSSFFSFQKMSVWKEKFSFFSKKDFLFPVLLALAWATAIFLMSWAPQWLKTDIPSRRIVSYLTWPASLLASIGLFSIFNLFKKALPEKICFLIFFFLLGISFLSSNQESRPYFLSNVSNSGAYQAFSAARYLADISRPGETILKDHVYLKGDTWVKLFLMRGYNEPLSRSNLSRYDDITKPRETCTRDIIANPDNEVGQKCLDETNVKYVLLKKNHGDQNFKDSPNWSKIFSNQETVIFSFKDNGQN